MTLDRYRDVVPDWKRFLEAAGRPEPTVLRVRRGRIATDELRERLAGKGFTLEPIPGMPDFLRVQEEPYPVSKTLEHWLGLFYIQQAVTGLAAPALAPGPGERVLDLCAAPGGKTVHLAEEMEDRGVLVASDADDKRLRALLGNLYRMGHPNVLAVQADGRSFPAGARFDRVLVDAPCSAEGNLRQRGGELRERDLSFVDYVTSLQEALLRRALELVRPGGRVLYVTCTFAPEENEGVVDAVLREGPVPATLEPIDLDVPHAPGLTGFGDRAFDGGLERARRLYPHHLDSGGLFMALLRRTDGEGGPALADGSRGGAGAGARSGGHRPSDEGWSPPPPVFPGDDTSREGARERIGAGRRGLSRVFDVPGNVVSAHRWIVRGNSVWVHRCPEWPLPAWREQSGTEGEWRLLSLGIRALKEDPRTPEGERPTSDLLRYLGPAVRDRIVDLDGEELRELLAREPLERHGTDDGFVALRHGGRIVGRGWAKRGVLRNEISKTRSRRLLSFLRAGMPEAAAGDV